MRRGNGEDTKESPGGGAPLLRVNWVEDKWIKDCLADVGDGALVFTQEQRKANCGPRAEPHPPAVFMWPVRFRMVSHF